MTYDQVWIYDTEYQPVSGDLPNPHCVVAHEVYSGQWVQRFGAELAEGPPFDLSPRALAVSWFLPAELSVHHSLGWPLPAQALCLWTEFRLLTNGILPAKGVTLLRALDFCHLSLNDAVEKDLGRELAIRGGPFSPEEQLQLVNYCRHDVEATVRLFQHLQSRLDLTRATYRAEYLAAVSKIEQRGMPFDEPTWRQLEADWPNLKPRLITRKNAQYGVFDAEGHLSFAALETYIAREGLTWPRTPTGRLKIDGDTLRDLAVQFPQLHDLRELFAILEQLDRPAIEVSRRDGRHRFGMRPFASLTGRNQPRKDSVLGKAVGLRSLLKPQRGRALLYVDWSFQEVAIAASLSNDLRLREACLSGDPYLKFGRMIGLVPAGATKHSHRRQRDVLKQLFLGLGYGMGTRTFARRTGLPLERAHDLLLQHRRTFTQFWQWRQAIIDGAHARRSLRTRDGWAARVTDRTSDRTLGNFPCQAGGAALLRLAIIMMEQAGIPTVAPLHDAVFLECAEQDALEVEAHARALMAEAGHRLFAIPFFTSSTTVCYPNRFRDERGDRLWRDLTELLGQGVVA